MYGTERKAPVRLVTAQEIIKLGEHSCMESMNIADEIYKASTAEYTGRGDTGTLWVFMRALSNIFEAGRLQGIREERLRRK